MRDSTQNQLRFPAIAGFTVRADFEGGALSSDFGPLLLRGVEQQCGLIGRLAGAIHDGRHPSYIEHSVVDLLRQRIYQSACGYVDGNDANNLRRDPMFKLALGHAPLDEATALASGPTFSRLENSLSRKDIYRLARAFVEGFIASYAQAPRIIVLDMDHSEDRTHGQQELAFYNHHYQSHCYLPLFLFEGLSGKLITAVLRPGKRPTGRENAAIVGRVLRLLRRAWPHTHIVPSSAWPATRSCPPRPSHCSTRRGRCASTDSTTPAAQAQQRRAPYGCMKISTTRLAPGPNPTGWYSRPR